MKFSTARKVTVAAAFVLVVVGLIFNTGTGTLSSFGWQQIAAICPLGVIEGFLANQTFFARALLVLGITVLLVALFGKAFCAWLCPVPSLKELAQRIVKIRAKKKTDTATVSKERRSLETQVATGNDESNLSASLILASRDSGEATDDTSLLTANEASPITPLAQAEKAALHASGCSSKTPLTQAEKAALSASGCSGCAERRKKFDSRHVVLGGTLLSAALFGFPVFCLICPIGLTFGTIIIFWQWVGFNDISFSLLLYPAILILELTVLRKWCSKFCPLGALLSLMSLPNRFFRPKVNDAACLRSQGIACKVCVEVCPEGLDPHTAQGMHECSKCGLCIEKCPSSAIALPFYKKTKNTELAH